MMRNNHTQAAGIACFGEILLRLAASHSELLLQTRTFIGHIGGAEANVAVALEQWGHSGWGVSVLPDNPLGHAAAGELRRYGVRTDSVQFRPGRMGLYFLTVGARHRPPGALSDRRRAAGLVGGDPGGGGGGWFASSGSPPAGGPTSRRGCVTRGARRTGPGCRG